VIDDARFERTKLPFRRSWIVNSHGSISIVGASRANYLEKISRRWIIQFLQDRESHFSIFLYLILVSQIDKKLIGYLSKT